MSKTALIDTNNCQSPLIRNFRILWQRNENDSLYIYYSKQVYNPDSADYYWSSPFPFNTTNNVTDYSVGIDEECLSFDYILSMHNDKIYVEDGINEPELLFTNTFTQPMKYLSFIDWHTMVKSKELDKSAFICFTGGNKPEREIYSLTYEYGYMLDTVNLSDNDVEDIDPRLFWGEYVPNPHSQYVYCVWQSKRNNNWPLYMSKNIAYFGE